jgi:PAS domain S-box-containing protein
LLTASAELARGALDAAPDAMIIIDASGVIRFANRQVSALFGYPHEQLIGKPVEALIPERFRTRHVGQRGTYWNSPRTRPMGVGLELFGQRHDGTEFPVEISLSPIGAEDAGGTLVAAAVRDVTDRKRLETELRIQLQDMHRLHAMNTRLMADVELPKAMEEILDATIALQGADFGNVQLYDAETSSLRIVAQRGFSDDFVAKFRVVDANDDTACGRALRERSRVVIEDVDKDSAFAPYRAIAAQAGYRAVQSTPMLGRDGILKGMLSTHFRQPHVPAARDLQLTDLYVRLAADLVVRTHDGEAIRAALEAADRANQAKGRFLATASHDLRQPLQTLALLNGTLRRSVHNSEAVLEGLAQQEHAIDAMSGLLRALLDISKLESGAIKPDPSDFAVNAMFEELRQEFASLAGQKGLDFKVSLCKAEDTVRSDQSLVGQILRNLVSNAVKYTREGWIALRCVHEGFSLVRLEVLDTGIGIPAEYLRFIYDEFYQVGGPHRAGRDGYGLGLSIVQRLVSLLDLKLDVQSEVGQGSRFALILPVSGVAAQPASQTAAQPVGQGALPDARILLVEDDAGVRNATRLLLKSEDYQVTAVASLAEALEHVRRDSRVDLLVTDHHLGDGELGTQVITRLREALGPQLKALLMTGDTSWAMQKLPPDPLMRLVSKPVNAEELLNLIRAFLAAA